MTLVIVIVIGNTSVGTVITSSSLMPTL